MRSYTSETLILENNSIKNMLHSSDTELLLSQIDLHQIEEDRPCDRKTEVAKYIKPEFKLELDDGDVYRSYILSGEYYELGRDTSSSILVSNEYISSHHATLRRIYNPDLLSGFTYQIIDGNGSSKLSTNGIFVNGKKVHKHNLESGDLIRLGPSVEAKFTDISLSNTNDNLSYSQSSSVSDLISYSIIDPAIVTDINGNIINLNRSSESKLGYELKEVLGYNLLDILFSGPWKEAFYCILSRFSQTQDSSLLGRWNNVEAFSKNGNSFLAEVSINCINANGMILLSFIIRDVTQNNLKKTQILHKIYEDPLTGLGNRRLFLKRLEAIFEESKNTISKRFAVLFIDLDRFKVVNDTFGHNVGDELLINVAHRLKNCLRDTDVIARQGGDEFTVLIEGEDIADSISQIASRLSDLMNQPYTIFDQQLVVTASIGVLLSSDCYSNTDEILRDADFAMYNAKSSGKATFTIFDNNIGKQASQSLRIDNDLRYAVDRKELFLEYQPIVSLASGKLLSFEALIRWNHPEQGLISPAEFIPIAENNGTITNIGYWVLHEACQQLKTWKDRHKNAEQISISVNLSIKQLEHPRIVEDICNILNETGLEPKYLKIEITETLLMENIHDTGSKLSELKKMGIQIHIDDFGTGYSSFRYLHELSVNALKIDKSFIDKLEEGGSGFKITQSIISLARVLGIKVIAEGVESSEQIKHLLSMKCDQVQGYYFSKPLNSEYAEIYLADKISTIL